MLIDNNMNSIGFLSYLCYIFRIEIMSFDIYRYIIIIEKNKLLYKFLFLLKQKSNKTIDHNNVHTCTLISSVSLNKRYR